MSQLHAGLSKCHRHRELICRWSGPDGTLNYDGILSPIFV